MAESDASALGVLTALLSLAVVVGVLGIMNTLILAVIERIREFGFLRAVGAPRQQVRAVVRWDAALIAMLGAALGTGVGVALAWIGTEAFTEFGIPFTVPSSCWRPPPAPPSCSESSRPSSRRAGRPEAICSRRCK